eukprot:CAMPEP_0113664486 /NCGR_PEP_ID=MMETSP0038_2-20120614/1761_1 /TAXON_ID=2898 /ORGANISM="Cryptomonas paramecium" /LENGTH=159 /DNA_ID=CAMNT_0000579703 /DNA_START=209 /DNA_END=684 /DNA_ORIENTATION=+ /assembly_acc=CAM_ASM_000170
MTMPPNNALESKTDMSISACEYHPDLGFVGKGNGVPSTESEAQKFALRARNPSDHGTLGSLCNELTATFRSIRTVLTDSPDMDIRVSGFVLPAFLSDEMRSHRRRLLVGCSVPSTPQALLPVADKLLECSGCHIMDFGMIDNNGAVRLKEDNDEPTHPR